MLEKEKTRENAHIDNIRKSNKSIVIIIVNNSLIMYNTIC